MISHALVTGALALTFTAAAGAARCFGLDGSNMDNSFQPCHPDAENSPCCAINKAEGDICLSSGLCYAQDSRFQGFLYQNGCTDESGLAEECVLSICPDVVNGWNNGDPVKSWNVLQCNFHTFCCRAPDSTDNCCDNKTALVTNISIGTILTATATSSPGTRTSTSDATSSITCTGAAGQTQDTCPTDNTAVVGGAVGGVLGAALLGALGVIGLLLRKRGGQASGAAAAARMSEQDPSERGKLPSPLGSQETTYSHQPKTVSSPSRTMYSPVPTPSSHELATNGRPRYEMGAE